MRISITLLLLLMLLTHFSFSQKIDFEKEYNVLLENLSKENWSKSEKMSKKLLTFMESEDSLATETKVLRYIYIYSTAGLLNEKKLSKEEALKKVLFLKGKEMIMPAHPFGSNCHVNCTHFAEAENTFFTGVNNAEGTQIFSFEYVKMKEKIQDKKEELEGKIIEQKGILTEISVEGNMLPRFKLLFVEGDYRIRKEE